MEAQLGGTRPRHTDIVKDWKARIERASCFCIRQGNLVSHCSENGFSSFESGLSRLRAVASHALFDSGVIHQWLGQK